MLVLPLGQLVPHFVLHPPEEPHHRLAPHSRPRSRRETSTRPRQTIYRVAGCRADISSAPLCPRCGQLWSLGVVVVCLPRDSHPRILSWQELLQRAQAKVEARARWQVGGQSGGRSCEAGAGAIIIRAAVPDDGGAAGPQSVGCFGRRPRCSGSGSASGCYDAGKSTCRERLFFRYKTIYVCI